MREIVEGAGVGFVFDPRARASVAGALERVEGAFNAGTLNRFDATAFLDERDESTYVERVLGAYGAGEAAEPFAA
jgi:hypothetical protein